MLVCVSCKREMVPDKNGVPAVEMASFGPYKLWQSDRWKCPKCGFKVLSGFSDGWVEHSEARFPLELNRAQANPDYIEFE